MGRPQKFSDEQILDAALAVVGRAGSAATVAEVAREMGGHLGSLYYRMPSRQVLLIRLWLRSVDRFQAPFLAALQGDDPNTALVAAACVIPDYCRQHPHEARALTLFRQARLLRDCPAEVRRDVSVLNVDVMGALDQVTSARYGRLDDSLRQLVHTAVQQLPYGLIRPHLDDPSQIPDWLTGAVATASPAVLALGDAW